MAVWILAACLGAAVVAVIGLWLALRHSRSRAGDTDALVAAARSAIHSAVEEETAAPAEEIRRTVARERADTMSQLAEEERERSGARRLPSVNAGRARRSQTRWRAWSGASTKG